MAEQLIALSTDLYNRLDAMKEEIKKTSEITDKNLSGVIGDLQAAKELRDTRVKAAQGEIALAEREFEDALSAAVTVISAVRQGFAAPKTRPQLVKGQQASA